MDKHRLDYTEVTVIKTIIIEDDPMVSFIHSQYLGRIDDILIIAKFANAAEAWDYLKKYSVDLIILDVYMPEMTGLELLHKLRTEGIQTDVIMVTADSALPDIKVAMNLGVLDYLVKPFEYERLCSAIEKFRIKHQTDFPENNLSQDEIDRLLNGTAVTEERRGNASEKGIQKSTLDTLLECLGRNNEEAVSCDTLSEQSSLSKVTVRRYMNYLIENDKAESVIDYQTGGRPRIRYRILKK